MRNEHTKRAKRLSAKRDSRPMEGSFEDANKWYRCWNCGFPFDITKISTGSGSGISHEAYYPEPATPVASSDPRLETLTLDNLSMVGGVLQVLPDGTSNEALYLHRKPVVTSGCPFCGTRNLP